MAQRPDAEVTVATDQVRELVASQHPRYAGRPLVEVAAGWDNTVYRLGDDLAVRLPRRQLGVDLLRNEQRWLPSLAGRLPLPVPAPVAVGRPGAGFPWPWSIVPWFEGEPAAVAEFDRGAAAGDLGEFLAALHQPAPPAAPTNPFRSVPVSERRASVVAWAGSIDDSGLIDVGVEPGDLIEHFDRKATTTSVAEPPRVWTHGDLHPLNILVAEKRISAVVDFGDLSAGCGACDLAAGWMLFDTAERGRFLSAVGADDEQAAHAEAWAVFFCTAFLTADGDGSLGQVGRRLLHRLFA